MDDNINSSLGDRRAARELAREHEQHILEVASSLRPVLQFQVSVFRMWATGFETVARNIETMMSNIADQRPAQPIR